MIVIEPKTKVVQSSKFKETKYEVELSPETFNVLSSKLYSEKYVAIVRELATNASDAHIAAGKPDVPIRVLCPSSVNNNFTVEDFGLGISPDRFEEIYSVYFRSTKTKTNNETGCFGLGSKSPFAETDQFTVENRHDSKCYIYSCYKKNGLPSVALISEFPTESSGLKVSFPVKPEKFYLFESAAKKVLPWFDVKPYSNVKFDKAAKNDKIFTTDNVNITRSCYVRMGQVLYPVRPDRLKDLYSSKSSVIINTEIGSVDIVPSRESLEFTPKTEETLVRLEKECKAFLLQEFEKIANDFSMSAFERYRKSQEYIEAYNLSPHTVKSLGNFCVFESSETFAFNSFCKSSWRSAFKAKNETSVDHESLIFINDCKKGFKSRISNYLTLNGITGTIFVFKPEYKQILIDRYNFVEKDFIYVSTLASPTTSRTYSSNKTNCCRLSGSLKIGTYLDKTVKSGIYVLSSEYPSISSIDFRKTLKLSSDQIYVFTDRQYENLKIADRDFVHLRDAIKNEFSDLEDPYYYSIIADAADVGINKAVKIMRFAEFSNESSPLSKLKNKYDFSKLDSNSISDLRYLYKIGQILRIGDFGDKFTESKKEIQKILEEINQRYPLLHVLLDSSDYYSITQDIGKYVELVDKKEVCE